MIKWLLSALIFFVLFLARFQTGLQANRNLDRLAGKPILVSGRISSQINLQGSLQTFYLGRIRVSTTLYPGYEYGDKLVISGILKREVINPWYSRFSLIYPNIKTVESGNNIFIGLKHSIETYFNRRLPEPEASLLAGIVLGSKRGLPQDFWQSLKETGTLHIVVASGYNVSVVIGVTIFLLAGVFSRPLAIGFSLLAVLVYSFMAGLEPAIIRAALMGSLAYFGQLLGKMSDGLRLLTLSAAAMLLYNPLFIWDIGFQLSVLATLGLLVLGPRLQPIFKRLPLIGAGMADSLAAQIMVWPVLSYHFGSLSLFSILVNGLILWLVPYIMMFSPVPQLAYVPLHLLVVIITWFAKNF